MQNTNRKKFTKKITTQIVNPGKVRKRHNQLFQAASKLFSQKGYHGTSMREISAASSINLSYIYKYVSSKDDILYLFYKQLHEEWVQIFSQSLASADENPVYQIKKVIQGVLEMGQRRKNEIQTMYTESRHLKKESLYAVLSAESEMINDTEKVIIRGEQQGYFHFEDSFMTANTIHYLLVIDSLRGWNLQNRYTPDQIIGLITNIIFKILGFTDTQELR